MSNDTKKVRIGYRMVNNSIIEGTISIPYHDGRETAWTLIGLDPDELRELSHDLDDLAYRVEAANLATATPKPRREEQDDGNGICNSTRNRPPRT